MHTGEKSTHRRRHAREQVATDAGNNIDECHSRRAPLLLHREAHAALEEHIGGNVHDARVQSDGGDQAPHLSGLDERQPVSVRRI